MAIFWPFLRCLANGSSKTLLGFVFLAAVGGCTGSSSVSGDGQTGNASATVLGAQYKHPSEDPCFQRIGDVWHHVGQENCVALLRPQRMWGVWVHDFEESSFLPSTTGIPRANNRVRFRVHLRVVPQDVASAAGTALNLGEAQAFAIDFIGRRSGNVGQDAQRDEYLVVVDRIISARYLGFVPMPDFVTALNEGREVNLNQPLPADLWNSSATQPN